MNRFYDTFTDPTDDVEECCGTCRHHKFDYDSGEWICNADFADNFGQFTEYKDTCEDWEDKDA